ncbi:hypothetical protein MMMDOFMJ_1444 [Methylobacterium gnaphalii]|nr:hypothetical protein MMMDOFMJ_1444 [Methylobacterium gnaphalii]
MVPLVGLVRQAFSQHCCANLKESGQYPRGCGYRPGLHRSLRNDGELDDYAELASPTSTRLSLKVGEWPMPPYFDELTTFTAPSRLSECQ